MNYKIRIKSPEHSMEVQNHLFSLGYEWTLESQTIIYTEAPILVFDSDSKRIYSFYRIVNSIKCFPEVELIKTVSYEFKEVHKREGEGILKRKLEHDSNHKKIHIEKNVKPTLLLSDSLYECPECMQSTGINKYNRYCHSCGVKFNWNKV